MMGRRKPEPMPDQFHVLAVYNAERSRGLVHTSYWIAAMEALQAEYDSWLRGRDQRAAS